MFAGFTVAVAATPIELLKGAVQRSESARVPESILIVTAPMLTLRAPSLHLFPGSVSQATNAAPPSVPPVGSTPPPFQRRSPRHESSLVTPAETGLPQPDRLCKADICPQRRLWLLAWFGSDHASENVVWSDVSVS